MMLLVFVFLLRVSSTVAFAFTTPSVSSPVRWGWSSSSSSPHGPHSIVVFSSSDNTKNTSPDDGPQQQPQDTSTNTSTEEEEENVVVPVGSKSYYKGFVASPIVDDTIADRGSGVEQAVKLGGGVTVGLIVLVLGFLASNGLL